MLTSLPVVALLLIFAAAAAVVWVAGVYLSDATDVLSSRFGLGQAIGGVVLLAVATNLPEAAITVTAALSHHLGVAIGNLLGGVAIQTVVLVLLDLFGVRGKRPLTYRAASLTLVLEGTLVAAVLVVTLMGTQLPAGLIYARLTPQAVLIAVVWLAGVWLLGKARADLPWQPKGDHPDAQQEPQGSSQQKKDDAAKHGGRRTRREVFVFLAAAGATLAAGWALEASGDAIAGRIHMTGVLFGATVLAASTSIPELATGLTSVELGDYKLACSDILGGNAFLPVLFLPATLLSGQAVLPQATATDIYLGGLGVLLTGVYVFGFVFRPRRTVLRMGPDSLAVLVLYAVGMAGLYAITRGR